jgi:zinc D-Ala-D-Ala carboxypeptidase
LDNAGLPEKSPPPLGPIADDIPIAHRETPTAKPATRFQQTKLLTGSLGAVAVLAITWGIWQGRSTDPKKPAVTASPGSTPAPTDPKVLGHFPYPEAPEAELQAVSADGQIRLRKAAAQAYQEMTAAAQAEGISLMPLSGFRSIKEQEQVFISLKQERTQTAAERANVSAPPGYSEHHTGYAIDIGDGNTPATNLSPTFEETAAFKWLQNNAPKFNFEMSFTKNNSQGVTYEPWHWRFVGDQQSIEMFFKAKSK